MNKILKSDTIFILKKLPLIKYYFYMKNFYKINKNIFIMILKENLPEIIMLK